MALAEPRLRHADRHHGCTVDFNDLQPVPHEWTRDQIATLRNWLPKDATTARARLSSLVDALQWREMLQGWFCYAAAGVAGLVFTRRGALRVLEPHRRGETFGDSVKRCIFIFLLSAFAWFVFQALTN